MSINTGLEPSRETLGSNFDTDEQVEPSDAETPADSARCISPDGPNRRTTKRRRRTIEHVWPGIGTRLDGEYSGETYAALVVAAPKLKAGRALQIINGPALGRVFNSMTAAMVAATAAQRRKLGLNMSKKGLPKSGWDFWMPVQAKRMTV